MAYRYPVDFTHNKAFYEALAAERFKWADYWRERAAKTAPYLRDKVLEWAHNAHRSAVRYRRIARWCC